MDMTLSRFFLLFFTSVLLLWGCRDSERDEDILTNTSEENALAEALFADAFKMVHEAALHSKGIGRDTVSDTTLFGCDKIIVDTTTSPRTMIIDFGFAGCEGAYNVNRMGRIIAEFTGTYLDSNAIVNMRFLNYNFGAYKIDGFVIVVNRGRNEAGNPFSTFFIENGTIATERTSFTWQGNKSWEQTAGVSTKSVSDDVFKITGTSFGINRKGNNYDTEVITPNTVLTDCFQLTSGTVEVNVKNISKRLLNYGSGNCDRNAAVTINGKSHEVTLLQ
jgi:hypothetical protein